MNRVSKIVLINYEGKLLLYLRDNKSTIPYPNLWDLIGGVVEKGESEIGALEREIKEEINYQAKNIKFIGDYYFREGDFILHCFTGEIDLNENDIKLDEGQRAKYFSFDELDKIEMSSIIKEIIDDYRKIVV